MKLEQGKEPNTGQYECLVCSKDGTCNYTFVLRLTGCELETMMNALQSHLEQLRVMAIAEAQAERSDEDSEGVDVSSLWTASYVSVRAVRRALVNAVGWDMTESGV